jgi:hypothetical protein
MRRPSIPLLALAFALSLASASAAQDQPPASDPTQPAQTPANAHELKPGADGHVPEEQIRELLRLVAEKDRGNQKVRRNYTYIQHRREDKLDGDGNVKSTETTTSEVLMIYNEQVERLLARNNKPLSEQEAAKEEQRIQEIIDKRKNESEEKRKKRVTKEEKRREQGRNFVQEVADAYNFEYAGIEKLAGRDAYVVDAEPRAGYKPRLKEARVLPKFRFRVWIDKDDLQWAKLDAVCIDTVSFGLFMARLHKGSRVIIEQTRVNEEVWLPKHVAVKIDARVALLKKYNVNQDLTYSQYRKFRSDAKIVGVQEVKQ